MQPKQAMAGMAWHATKTSNGWHGMQPKQAMDGMDGMAWLPNTIIACSCIFAGL